MANKDDVFNIVPLGDGGVGVPTIEMHELAGLKIKAFYDAAHKLLFAIDLTRDSILPNALLVLEDREGRKWDDILQNDFQIKPESVRPRSDNKYQKLDIDYEGLNYYADAIWSKNADALVNWRYRAAERQRYLRVDEAERELALARETAAEAEKTVNELEEFIALQKEKLRAAKKNLGKEPPKDSAAKILKFEAKIDKAQEKKARSQRRLRRAEHRIEKAEQMLGEYKSMIIPKAKEMNDSDVKPLFTEHPNIVNANEAFRPVLFDAPVAEEEPKADIWNEPKVWDEPETPDMPAPVAAPIFQPADPLPPLEPFPSIEPQIIQPTFTMAPPSPAPDISGTSAMPIFSTNNERPAPPPIPPSPIAEPTEIEPRRGQSGAYYVMLALLIGLSIFTLYLYQKKIAGGDEVPKIAARAVPGSAAAAPASVLSEEEVISEERERSPIIQDEADDATNTTLSEAFEDPFLDLGADEPQAEETFADRPSPMPIVHYEAEAALLTDEPTDDSTEDQIYLPLSNNPVPSGFSAPSSIEEPEADDEGAEMDALEEAAAPDEAGAWDYEGGSLEE